MEPGQERSVLVNLGVDDARTQLPTGFQRLHATVASLEADLNLQNAGGEPRFLIFQSRKIEREKSLAELAEEKKCRIALEGTWQTTEGQMELKCTGRRLGRSIRANHNFSNFECKNTVLTKEPEAASSSSSSSSSAYKLFGQVYTRERERERER